MAKKTHSAVPRSISPPGAKCMPKSHMLMGSGKMSSAHGLTKNTSPTKGMSHAEGRIGAGTRGFSNTLTKTPGKA